jgi:hypothetical protein
MSGGEDWLLRPVLRGLCRYESLRQCGELNLVDFAIMNEAIDVEEHNASALKPPVK